MNREKGAPLYSHFITPMSKISYNVTIFATRAGEPSVEQRVAGSDRRWQLLRTVALVTLGLSVLIALLLAAFVVALILAIPLIVVTLYSLGRLWWRRSFGARSTIR